VSYVDSHGVHTHYEEHGSGDPVLLLHGGLVLDFLAAKGPATTMPLRRR
jgi:pimeloyl-ACP methyl ester carboxylesterase